MQLHWILCLTATPCIFNVVVNEIEVFCYFKHWCTSCADCPTAVSWCPAGEARIHTHTHTPDWTICCCNMFGEDLQKAHKHSSPISIWQTVSILFLSLGVAGAGFLCPLRIWWVSKLHCPWQAWGEQMPTAIYKVVAVVHLWCDLDFVHAVV